MGIIESLENAKDKISLGEWKPIADRLIASCEKKISATMRYIRDCEGLTHAAITEDMKVELKGEIARNTALIVRINKMTKEIEDAEKKGRIKPTKTPKTTQGE